MKKFHAIILTALIALIFAGRSYFRLNPFERTFIFDEPSYAVSDGTNNLFIIHENEKSILSIDGQQALKFEIKGGNRSDKGFYHAKEVLTADNGFIYVVDIVSAKGGGAIEAERILKYSPDGKFIENVYLYAHEEGELKRKISGLSSMEGELYFVFLDYDSISLIHLESGETIASYPFEEAYIMIGSAAINPQNMELAFTGLDGEIYITSREGNQHRRLDIEGKRIPRDVKYSASGDLYFTDIGTREIYKATPVGIETIAQSKWNFVESPIYYRLSLYNGGLIATAGDIRIIGEDGSCEYISEYRISNLSFLLRLLMWVAILAAFVLLIRIIKGVYVNFSKNERSRISHTSAILPALFIIIPIISFVILSLAFQNFNQRFQKETLQRMSAVSQFMTMILDVDTIKSIDGPEGFMSETYRKMREDILKSFAGESKLDTGLYCVLYKVKDGVIYSCFSLEDDTGAMYPYDWIYEGSTEQWIYENKTQVEVPGISTAEGWWMFVLSPLLDADGNVAALIEVGTDLYALNEANSELLRDLTIAIIAIAVVILLLAIEILSLIDARREMPSENSYLPPVNIIRPIVFVIFFATNISTAFLPLYANQVLGSGTALFGLPRELLIALPISVEILFTALFSAAGGFIVDRIGERKTSIAGSVFLFAGLAVRAVIPDIYFLIIGNGISGIGSGLLLLVMNVMIAERQEDEKNKGFASYSAAMLSGMNCGIVIGSTLTLWLNYQAILYIGAFFTLLGCIFVLGFIKDNPVSGKDGREANSGEPRVKIISFLRSPRVLLFFLTIMIPYLMCGYFLIYSFPILASDLGMSEANIGYAFLLNGLCVIFLGPSLSGFIQRRVSKEIALAISVALYVLAFLIYAFIPDMPILLLAVVILGIADSFGFTIQSVYFTGLKEVERYGYSKAMGLYSLVENTAQTLGPIVFSYILIMGAFKGMVLISGIFTALLAVFLLFSATQRRRNI